MYVCVYIYIYIYPSQSIIDASIDCTLGKMVQPISRSFFGQRKQVQIDKFAVLTMPHEFFAPSHFLVPVVHRHGNLMLNFCYNTMLFTFQ